LLINIKEKLKNQKIMFEQNGVKYGAIAGLGLIITTLLLYIVSAKVMFNYTSLIGYIIYIASMVKSVSDDKAASDGYITFRNAFQSSFIVFVIASFLNLIFWYILVNIIDPSLIDLQIEIAMEAIEKIADFAGMSEADLEEAALAIEESSNQSIMQMLQAYLFGLVAGAIPALIIAAAMKKAKPLHIQAQEEELNDDDHLVEK
jgi:hypothetical protein